MDQCNCIPMSISLRSAFMPHYFPHHSAAFACSKWLIILIVFRLAPLRVFVVIPALLYRFIHCPPFISFLSSLRVSLGILFSSLLGISLSSSCDLLSPFTHLFAPPSLYFSSFESAWAYCSARSWNLFPSLPFLSLL